MESRPLRQDADLVSSGSTAEPESLRRRLLQGAAIACLALTINLAGNGRVSLWDRDEPRYATCVREMRGRGDWINPSFNGEPRYQKPILIYWLMRAGFAIGGDNPFGVRLVSGLAGMGTCLAVWVLGRRMISPRAGLLAALMLATAPIMVVESKLATTDATLTILLLGCQFCLWELGQRPSRRVAATFWVLLALATLTKGPVGIALIGAAGVVAWWWGGSTSCWKRLHWRWGLVGFAAITLPWCIAIGVSSRGKFFEVALGQQFGERLTNAVEQHGGFPGYYVVTTLAMFYPWSALLPVAIAGAWGRRRAQRELAFLLGWVVGPLILLECVRTKIVHYYVPSYPACALLVAWLVGVIAPEGMNLRRWPLGRVATGLLGGVGIVFTVALLALLAVAPWPLRWPLIFMGLTLAAGTLYALHRFMQGATERAVGALVITWGAIMLAAGAWALPAAEPFKLSRIVGERLAVLAETHQAQPVLLTFQEPSIIFALGRPAPEVRDWNALFAQIDRHGAVLVAVFPKELEELRTEPAIAIEIRDTLRGFNLSKGRAQELLFAEIRRDVLASRAVPRKQLLVK